MSRQIHYNKIKMICLVVEWCWAISIRWELEYDCCVVQRSTVCPRHRDGATSKSRVADIYSTKKLVGIGIGFPFSSSGPEAFQLFL